MILQTILGISFTFVMTMLGSGLVFFFKNDISEKLNSIFNGLSAGIMLAATIKKLPKELREIMDSFLGTNACQKIFGDRNYYEMYEDLFVEMSKPQEELGGKSHFEMLDMTSDGIKRRLIAKYGKTKSNEVI